MKLTFSICFFITTIATTRLGLFMKHHSRLPSRAKVIKEKLISKSKLPMYAARLREFTGKTKVKSPSKLESQNKKRVSKSFATRDAVKFYQARRQRMIKLTRRVQTKKKCAEKKFIIYSPLF